MGLTPGTRGVLVPLICAIASLSGVLASGQARAPGNPHFPKPSEPFDERAFVRVDNIPPCSIPDFLVGYERRYSRGRVHGTVDLFNVLNHGADELHVIGADPTFNPNFRRSRVRQPPRAAQISIRLAF